MCLFSSYISELQLSGNPDAQWDSTCCCCFPEVVLGISFGSKSQDCTVLVLNRGRCTTTHTAVLMFPSSPHFTIPAGIASQADAWQDKTAAWNSSWSPGASSESDLDRGHNRSWLRLSSTTAQLWQRLQQLRARHGL